MFQLNKQPFFVIKNVFSQVAWIYFIMFTLQEFATSPVYR